MSKGIFGDLFDMNGDGTLDIVEQAADYLEFKRIQDDLDSKPDGCDDGLDDCDDGLDDCDESFDDGGCDSDW